MKYRVSKNGSVPVLYCRRQGRWLPIEEHLDCEHCAAPVFDEDDEPVSYLCTYDGETRRFRPDHDDGHIEEGRGYPANPDPTSEGR